MKNILVLTFGLMTSPFAFGACDSNKLDANQLAECITIEGAGENYDHWRDEYEQIGTGQSREEHEGADVSALQAPLGVESE